MPRFPWERPTMDDFIREAELRFSNIFNLSVSDITDAISSACKFFGIPYPDMVLNLTSQPNGATMFVNKDKSTYADDIICYNLLQLQNLGVSNKTAFTLIMTHECAHRYFQQYTFPGLNNGQWEEELACDFCMGVRSILENLDIRRVAEGLGRTQGAITHPDGDLRYQAILDGQGAVKYLTENGFELCLDNYLRYFEEFRKMMEPTIFARELKYQNQQV